MTRRLLLVGLIASLLALGLGGWILWPRPPSAITRENAAKIQVGMGREEVEAILGGPARDETTGPIVFESMTQEEAVRNKMNLLAIAFRSDNQELLVWCSDRVQIEVRLDAGGVVGVCRVILVRRSSESHLDTLRRWLRL